MANLSSSKKMVRKITKRTERNKSLRTNLRTYIRRFEEAIASGETNEAQIVFNIVEPKLMKLAQKGIVHKKNACLLYTSPSPRDMRRSRMPSSA